MIPLVPFSPFFNLNNELSQQLGVIVRLQDQLMLPKGQVYSVRVLQALSAEYLQILNDCGHKNQCFFSALTGCQLFDCFARDNFSDKVSAYVCVAGIVDSKADLLRHIKQLPVRPLRRALTSLTKDMIGAMAVCRTQLAQGACADLLKKQYLKKESIT